MTRATNVQEMQRYSSREWSLFTITLFCMSILLHQSNVIFGVNISFADIFCFCLLVFFAYHKQLVIPVIPMVFFIIVSMSVLFAALFYVPYKFLVYPAPRSIISEMIKLLAIILYFLIGYNLSAGNRMEETVKWYSFIGVAIGFVGVLLTIFNLRSLSSQLFYGDIRFRGLMNDPNYFAVLQVTTLIYFTRVKALKSSIRYFAYIIIIFSVMASGSKTGIITFLLFFLYRVIEYFIYSKKKLLPSITQLVMVALIVLLVPLATGSFQVFLSEVAEKIPSFARIQLLFNDFSGAISGDGSERDAAWGGAMQIITSSPLAGIGIGTYMAVVTRHFQVDDIAHNTFLQLSAEWGLPLAFCFFFFVGILIIRGADKDSNQKVMKQILRDILLVLLIGSMAISLNNSRLLWLILGALTAVIFQEKYNWKKGEGSEYKGPFSNKRGKI